MEKPRKRGKMIHNRQKLPSLPESKSQLLLNRSHPLQLLSSTDRLKDLRTLYFQYKSNANILNHSPYYPNQQKQRKVAAFIRANKYSLDPAKQREIYLKFGLSSETNERLASSQSKPVLVKMMIGSTTMEYELSVRSVGQLDSLLKLHYALQEYKTFGQTKKAQLICGFESVTESATIDYQLSLKQHSVFQQKLYLKPIFAQLPKESVKLSSFKLVRCLGSGGFSLVYLVRDKWMGKFYALKLIDKDFILQSERQTIVQNERYVLGQLQSPFVTGLRFCFQTKNHFAFLIEYCPGGQLFYQLKKVKRMTEQQAKFYFLQILIGLDYIHQKGIVYRDLKPQNLLIAVDGHIKIADFGLAKPLLTGSRQTAYSFCGSPEYMAPEMLMKSGHTYTLDYYCLGALLYELVIGIPPYYSLNHQQIYKGILNEELTFPNHTPLSAEIKSLLKSLLEKNPMKRLGHLYGIKEILIHPWVGKNSKKIIEDKGLTPPFLPDLTAFNFDETQLQQRSQEVSAKIEQDLQNAQFETHFNNEFYYQDPTLSYIRQERSAPKVQKVRKQMIAPQEFHKWKSAAKQRLNNSLESRRQPIRNLSQRSHLRY